MRYTLALLLDHLVGDYSLGLYQGVRAACRQHDVNLLTFVGDSLDSPVPEGRARNAVYELARSKRVDGVILGAGCLQYFCGPVRFQEFCDRFSGVPRCCIGGAVAGVPSVLVDNMNGMRVLIEHLIRHHSFRRIAFVCGPDSVGEGLQRLDVYRDTMSGHGLALDPDLILPGNFQIDGGALAVRTLRSKGTAFDAIVAANDNMALGALEELSRLGTAVPASVAVAGFDDVPLSRVGKIALTTVRQPLAAQGRLAVQTILTQLAGGTVPDCVTLDAELVARESCGCGFDVTSSSPAISIAPLPLPSWRGQRAREVLKKLLTKGLSDLPERIEPLMEPVVDALQRHLDGADASEEFVSALSSALTKLDSQADVYDRFQRVFTAMHARLKGGQRDEARRLGELLQRAHIAVSTEGVRALARERMALEGAVDTLRQTGARLATSVDLNTVMSELRRTLPRVGIQRACLSEFDAGSDQLQPLLWLQPGRSANGPSIQLEALALAPDAYFDTEQRFEHVVSALCAGADLVGLAVLEAGDACPTVFGSVRDQLAASLKALRLQAGRREAIAGQQRAEQARLRSEIALSERIQGDLSRLGRAFEDLQVASSASNPERALGYADALLTPKGAWLLLGDVPVPDGAVSASLVHVLLQSVAATLADGCPEEEPQRVLAWIAEVLGQNLGRRLGLPARPQLTLLSVNQDRSVCWSGPCPAPLWHSAKNGETRTLPGDGTTLVSAGDVLILRSPALRQPFDDTGARVPSALVTQLQRHATSPIDELCSRLLATLGAPERGASLLVARCSPSGQARHGATVTERAGSKA